MRITRTKLRTVVFLAAGVGSFSWPSGSREWIHWTLKK